MHPPPSARLIGGDVDMLPASYDHSLIDDPLYPEEDMLEDDQLQGLMGIDEYEKVNPYTPPPRKGAPCRLDQNKGVHSSAFFMLAQQRGLKVEFSFREREQGCFYVSVKVNDQSLGEIGPYGSKRDAKEAICQQKLSELDAFGNHKKRKSSGMQQENLGLAPEGFAEENWIGELNGYLQAKQLRLPEYVFTGLHPSMGPWFCTVRFQGGPLTPFGHGMGPFARKDEAKKVAAMEAVRWLRQQGQPKQSSIKRRKSATSPPALAPGDTGLTQKVQLMDVQNENTPLSNKSAAHQVHDKAVCLGFTQPAFPTEPLDGAFLNMWATFLPSDIRKEPRLAGQVCRIGPIFGKKAAKEECCRELLRLFHEIEQSRRTPI